MRYLQKVCIVLSICVLSVSARAQVTFQKLATANAPAATLEFTGITGFRYYKVLCSGLFTVLDNSPMWLQFGTGSGPVWQTSGYKQGGLDREVIYLTGNSGSITPDWPVTLEVDTEALDDTAIHKTIRFVSKVFNGDGTPSNTQPNIGDQGNASLNANTLAITALRIGTSFTSGECSLFGIVDPPSAAKKARR